MVLCIIIFTVLDSRQEVEIMNHMLIFPNIVILLYCPRIDYDDD